MTPADVTPRIAVNLLALRRQAGVTQAQLARSAGLSRATVHLIESGQGDPRVSTLELLAGALAVDVEDLICPPVRRSDRAAPPCTTQPGPAATAH